MLLVVFSSLVLLACTENEQATGSSDAAISAASQPSSVGTSENNQAGRDYTEEREACQDYAKHGKPLFGELHIHTSLSFDAAASSLKTLPSDAYRFAKGESIPFFPVQEDGTVTGSIKIDRPLDFAAITDHGEYLGETLLCKTPGSAMYDSDYCVEYREIEFRGSAMMATSMSGDSPRRIVPLCGEDGEICRESAAGPWQVIRDAAEEAYDRSSECRFTSFVGYEYTGSPNNSNYHRNVIFRNANVPRLPLTYMEYPFDYLLWDQLEKECNNENNCDYLTIPHNSNISNGRLLTPYADMEPTLENRKKYASQRLRSEPMMEIFQHKGGSECINGLGSVIGAPDELCDVEQVRPIGGKAKRINIRLDGVKLVMEVEDPAAETTECTGKQGRHGMMGGGCVSPNDFLRTALLTGLAEQQETGLNPVKLGVVAASDGHVSTPGSVKESTWKGYVTGEIKAENRLKPGTLTSGILGNPGGLAGVWARENSRDAIFDAMQRREVFGTSGPRIVPRFFAGWDFPDDACERTDMISMAYASGVPMGGDLPASADASSYPRFILSALADSATDATALQQLQLIKGWIAADGEKHYQVITVAGNADNGAGVNTETGEIFGDGHANLCAVYEDRDFDPALPAYYYLRAVENPSPRWSLLDCLKVNEADRPAVCADKDKHVIQEMAWSSPVWYAPGN